MDYNVLMAILISSAVYFFIKLIFFLIDRNCRLEDQLKTDRTISKPLIEKPYQAIPLSKRELEVAILVGEGLGNKEIAERLSISPYTVNNHVENIKEKTGCSNKAMLAAHLLRTGIIE